MSEDRKRLAEEMRAVAARLAWYGQRVGSELPPLQLCALRLAGFAAHAMSEPLDPLDVEKLTTMHSVWMADAMSITPHEARHARGAFLVARCGTELSDIKDPETRRRRVAWLVSELCTWSDGNFERLDEHVSWMCELFENFDIWPRGKVTKLGPIAILARLALKARALGRAQKKGEAEEDAIERVRANTQKQAKTEAARHPEFDWEQFR